VVLTTGIVPGSTRAVSAEGIEMDMAVSTLSRHVLLKALMPRLAAAPPRSGAPSRVFVMGFPGSGEAGELGDLNAEKTFASGFGRTHMNTVAGNESLVHHWAAAAGAGGAYVYGLNPGLIPTGIRNPVHGGGFLGRIIEGITGLLSISADQYAEHVVPLFVAPELAAHRGALFSQRGVPILPSPAFTDAAYVAKWVAELDALAARAQAAK
jgi:hypothetical protein